ncbi:unnamed protein product [Paramecium pentaurelia]|uniref:Uncharacterized protein n=1 Tax=Paramecium pentaurelia TaxID=43138 RepID=A0A8S1TDA2_9CILI|nr:unnamed protein product [Paramecium pentaurelia]
METKPENDYGTSKIYQRQIFTTNLRELLRSCHGICQFRQGLEIIEEEAGKSKKHLENFGVMNLSNNIRRLFMLNLRMCKEHTNWRCGIKHLNQVRSINIYDIIDCALKQRAWANIKKETECRIQEILEKYEGDYMEQ